VFAFQTALLASTGCTASHGPQGKQGDEAAVDDSQLDAGVAQAGRSAPAMDGGEFDNNPNPLSIPRQHPSEPIEPDDGDGGHVPVPIYGGPFPDPRSRAKV
jgi:hypothetical protein